MSYVAYLDRDVNEPPIGATLRQLPRDPGPEIRTATLPLDRLGYMTFLSEADGFIVGRP